MNKLKQKIIEANEDIMKLQFGCEIECEMFGKKEVFIMINTFLMTEKEIRGGTYLIEKFKNDGVPTKILGRPITLADVLVAMQRTISNSIAYDDQDDDSIEENQKFLQESVLKLLDLWNLRKNSLDEQSEPTINFLKEILL